jgi:hypothetical protein
MTDAYVETTVITDLLLKKDGSEKAALTAIGGYTQFAWKEFKRGPLGHFIWFYNKLFTANDYGQALSALQRMSRTPRRYQISIAIQAVHTGFSSHFSEIELPELQRIYGDKATIRSIVTDAMKLELKRVIMQSWGKRHSLFGGWIQTLDCYPDVDLSVEKGTIDPAPRDCPRDADCCLRARIAANKGKLADVWRSLSQSPENPKQEWSRRKKVLRDIDKRPSDPISAKDCQSIGDAYFVLFCPSNATIVTTNVDDIRPMAEAIGITVIRP